MWAAHAGYAARSAGTWPPGQWIGLIPIIDGKGTIHNLRPHAAMVLLHVPRSAFQQALRTDQGLALMCLNLLCQRSRSVYCNMATETLLPLCARTARLLLMLVEQRHAMHGIELSLKLTRDDFPDMPGVTRQILNRELKTLEKQGLLTIAYSPITLHDVQHGGADGSRPGSHRLSHWRNPQNSRTQNKKSTKENPAMTSLLQIVVCMTALTFISIMLGAVLRNREWTIDGMKAGLSNRDNLPEATPMGARAEKAAQNTKENFLLFIALAGVAHAAGMGEQATFGAEVFFWARVVYLPVYIFGITYVRSAVWGVGIAGLVLMMQALY